MVDARLKVEKKHYADNGGIYYDYEYKHVANARDVSPEQNTEDYKTGFVDGVNAALDSVWDGLCEKIPDSDFAKYLKYDDLEDTQQNVRNRYYDFCHTTASLHRNMQNCMHCPYRNTQESGKFPFCHHLVTMMRNWIITMYYYQLYLDDESDDIVHYFTSLDEFADAIDAFDEHYDYFTNCNYPHAGEYRFVAKMLRSHSEVFSDVLRYLMVIDTDWSDEKVDVNLQELAFRFNKIIPIAIVLDENQDVYDRLFNERYGMEHNGWVYRPKSR